MPAPPTASRPAPPAVPPVVHDGVRFEQDLSAMPPSGAAAGGGLAAYDVTSNQRLWQLQVYTVPDNAPPGVSHPGRYFASMTLSPERDRLLIEDEAGVRYGVDLRTRAVTRLGGPPEAAPAQAPAKPKPKPTPQ